MTWEYLAGLFDGEGCIHMMTNNCGNPQLKVTITQANTPLLHMVTVFAQMGTVSHAGGKWEVWNWRLTKREDIHTFLLNLYPHLILKKAEAEIAIEICKLNPVQGRHTPPEDREKQVELASKLKQVAAQRKEDRHSLQEVM